MSETENKNFPYPIPQPDEVTSGERDDAMSSYLMMFASWLIGLPIPFINMLAAVVFFLVNRRKSRFVAFHAYQNMLSNIFTSLLNSFMIGWTIRAIFAEQFSKWYVVAIIAVILINIFYAISSLVAAMRAYRGRFYYQLFFGRWAFDKYYGPNAKPLDPGPGVNAPPPGV